MTERVLTVGVNHRFDGTTGQTVCEKIAFFTDGSSRNITSRQELRRAKRQGDKALVSMLKAEARKMGRAAGGASLATREDARKTFADMLARGEKPLEADNHVDFKHPWQR